MAKLYQRKYKLTVTHDGKSTVVEKLRVEFVCKMNLKTEPNTADIKIYNLSEATANQIADKTAGTVVLEGGYEEEMGVIFKGTITHVLTSKIRGDTITHIEAHDGLKSYSGERIDYAAAGVSDFASVVKAIISKISGKDPDLLVAKALKAVADKIGPAFNRGFAGSAKGLDLLNQALGPAGMTASIQNGELIAVTDTSTVGRMVLISGETGLVASPSLMGQETKPGQTVKPKATVKLKNLLRHVFTPGTSVSVSSQHLKGTFRIEAVNHSGDTHGANWTSELELYEVK